MSAVQSPQVSTTFSELPLALLLELTHRCPLQCPYCSNPIKLTVNKDEISTAVWLDVLQQAAEMGVLQAHFSGGEPMLRADLETLVAAATELGLYTNLITSGVVGDEKRLTALREAGLEHIQISFQDSEAAMADMIGGYPNGHTRKLAFARIVHELGFAMTFNAPVYRHNVSHVPQIIEMALTAKAERLEVAHIQYYGWGLKNRAALMPTRTQLDLATQQVQEARVKLNGQLKIDYVVPDYYARRPKACMGGWGQRVINIDPAGEVLPCHAAQSIPDLYFDNVRNRPLREIWLYSEAFQTFRGTDWMPEPCKSCAHKTLDWGGCRCQSFAILGDATQTDPVCEFSPHHGILTELAEEDSATEAPVFVYRKMKKIM